MSEGSARVDRSAVLAAFDGPAPMTTGEVADAVGSDPGAVETALSALVESDELGHRPLAVEGSEVDLWYPAVPGSDETDRETTDPDATATDSRDDRDGFEWVEDAGATGESDAGRELDEGDAGRATTESDAAGSADAGWSPDEVTVRGSADATLSGGGEDATPGGADDRVEAAIADLAVPGASEMMRDWRRNAVRAAFDHLRERGDATTDEIRESAFPANSAGYEDPDAWWSFVAPRLADLPGVERDGEEWSFTGPG